MELGCGSGVLAGALITGGYSVVGVDVSKPMLDLARESESAGTYVHASLHEFQIPECVAVVSIGEGIGYVRHGDHMLDPRPLFGRVATALHAGGLFLFDVMVEAPGDPLHYRSWSAGKDWAVLVEVAEDRASGQVRRDIVTFRSGSEGTYRRAAEVHRARLFNPNEVVRWLGEAGFEVRLMDGYGAHPLASGRQAFWARKK